MKINVFKVAMSLAASWAWGTSLIVGMELIQTKGILPFIIWAVANSLAIPLFGLVAYRIPNLQRMIESKPIMMFSTVVSVFCLWIQMNAIFQQISTLCNNDNLFVLKAILIVVFILLSIILYNNGVIKCIKIDYPIWGMCYGILIMVLLCGVISGAERYEIVLGCEREHIIWAINSCFILFSGPIMCIQNWQVAKLLKIENKMKAHYFAGGLFAVYMMFVGVLGIYKFNGVMGILVAIVVLIVAFTTANGAIVGLQEIAGKKIGMMIAIVATLFWPFVVSIGVMNLWTVMGNMRKYVVLFCIVVGCGIELIRRIKRS